MFFPKKTRKHKKESFFFRNLFNYFYSAAIYCLFRILHKRKNFFLIILFYKSYKSFNLNLKKIFFKILLNNFYNQLKMITKIATNFYLKVNNKQNYCLWYIKKDFFYVNFSFLQFFVYMDIVKSFFVNNNIILQYIFQIFIKFYLNKNIYLIFLNCIWHLVNLFFCTFEKTFYRLKNNIVLKNSSKWKMLNKYNFKSSLYYLFKNSNFILYYIRSLNMVYFSLFCKIKYVFKVYKDIKFFFKFYLKANLTNKAFSFKLVNKNTKKFLFINSYLYSYIFSKINIRINLILILNNKLFLTQYYEKIAVSMLRIKNLFFLFTRAFLQYFSALSIKYKKRFFSKISFLFKKYFRIKNIYNLKQN